MSEQEPGPTHTPYGQSDPYGQPPSGQPSPYGQAPAYGAPTQPTDRRPGTVTAAAWITMVLSAIVAALFGFTALALLVARDQVIVELEKVPEFQDADIDPDAAVGVLVAVLVGLVIWALIAIVLAVLVLRRSSVARILLVISAVITALFSLVGVGSGVSAVTLVAAIAVVVLLFTGGAGAWFNRRDSGGGYPGGYAGGQHGATYGGQPGGPYGQSATPPPSVDNPYGQSPSGPDPYGQQPSDNPYGQPPAEGGTDYPPRDYPNR
ncbi:hypothetical protein [Nocardioides sp.]|uniref:hypothetical protein n=1 Tax=Nocardioides sp. TaxID=35761 RepID=UPI00262E748B|nr:hypothetical protein [Nocardioides sp.]MCW2739153.1 hypothetical protein [Nocardioides sp.]